MISRDVENLIIKNYLLGSSRDEIAESIGVGKGTVSNKINEWKKESLVQILKK
jgi:transposase